MRNRPNPAEALVQLARLEAASTRQAAWRQAIAALAQSAGNLGPPPLDGLDEQVLERAAHIAIETGLADDLEWIFFQSALWTWTEGCGRAGWIVYCPRCDNQVCFHRLRMS